MDLLIAFLQDHGIEVKQVGEHHHATRGWVQVDCPYCSGKGSSSFRLGLTPKSANCWQCGPKYILRVLMDLTGTDAKECRKYVSFYDQPLDQRIGRRGKLELPSGLGPLLPAHKKYLKELGYNPDRLEKNWKLQGIGMHQSLAWRIFIPFILDGEIVSWTTRTIGTSGRKYIAAAENQEVFSSKSLLYGEDKCRHRVMVVEGPFDAMKVGPGAVATSGINYTAHQVLRISKFPVRYICFDNEPQAQRQARKLCEELCKFAGTTHNVQIEAKDPGSARKDELKQLRSLLTQ